MIRLIVLLLGAQALHGQRRALWLFGWFWIITGVLMLVDVLQDGRSLLALDALALMLALEGLVAISAALVIGGNGRPVLLKGFGFIFMALLVFDVPADGNIISSVVFGSALLLDGVVRIASSTVIQHRRWKVVALAGSGELLLSLMIFIGWPAPHRMTVPFCFGLMMILSGWALLRISRRLMHFALNRHHTAVPTHTATQPLTVYVWTPLGSAKDARRRYIVDRYIAAVDGAGVISTGHTALELAPDIYISHYPRDDIDRSAQDFRRLLHAGEQNNVAGRFLPNLQQETAEWCPPDKHIHFCRYNPSALRAFWQHYRQDDTYNLTRRNCSTTVISALDSALEGVLGGQQLWRRFLMLALDPNLWVLAMLRSRGESMTWTPGLVLDYTRMLKQVTEHQDQRWLLKLRKLTQRLTAIPRRQRRQKF
ncbi:HdeD family acid-resistance protein [Serratia sp. AKBS12]|uniref:HdeD family acid-resistance protein n=1 Tax=Serratia sp. AKBS12 TaxID=2974597 RepID=UPI0021660061|nr:protease [Serratia sp. AKBS12]MCS3408939.1 protease [Serratia sp. AKBS12]